MPPFENHYSYGCFYFKGSDDAEWQHMGSADSLFKVKDDFQCFYDPITHACSYDSEKDIEEAFRLIDDILKETKKDDEMKEKEQPKDLLDKAMNLLKTLRDIKGYLLINDVLDIFDMKDTELTSEGKKVNPFELYCGNLDDYVRDMKFHRSVCLNEIKVSENVEEIRKLVDDINNIDEALSKLEDDEE